MAYNYPPSNYILKYGPFEPNTHFHVKGQGEFDRGTFECEFEVAYTQNGEIIIVCYFTQVLLKVFFDEVQTKNESSDQIASDKQFRRRETGVACKSFSGNESRRGWNIVVEEAAMIRGFVDPNEPIVFIGTRLRIKVNEAIEFTDKSYIYFQIVGLDYPIIDTQQFDIGGKTSLQLQVQIPSPNQTFHNQPTAQLWVPLDSLSTPWQASTIAELWCALSSLASGKDIRWTSEIKWNSNIWEEIYHRQRNLFGNRDTFPFLSDSPYFLNDPRLHSLIKTAFTLRKQSINERNLTEPAALAYAQTIRRFIEYLLITNRTEDQARLITTMIEELVELWEDHSNRKLNGPVDENRAEKIWKQLKKELKGHITEAIKLTSTTDEDLARQEKIALAIYDRMRQFFKIDITRPTNRESLENLFLLEVSNSDWFEDHVKKRLSSFIATRNHITHTGRFATKNRKEWLRSYYQMVMIFPLIIFAIFQYRGEFVDIAQIELDREEK